MTHHAVPVPVQDALAAVVFVAFLICMYYLFIRPFLICSTPGCWNLQGPHYNDGKPVCESCYRR